MIGEKKDEIENIVCSVRLSKKLKEFKVKQKSICDWFYDKEANKHFASNNALYDNQTVFLIASAFTGDELLKILPKNIPKIYAQLVVRKCEKHKCKYIITYYEYYEGGTGIVDGLYFHRKKLSDALAELLVVLLEHKSIQVEELNDLETNEINVHR